MMEKETERFSSERRFRSLFIHNPDSIFALNLKGEIVSANPAAEKTFGYNSEDLKERSYDKFISKDDQKKAVKSFRKALNGESSFFEGTVFDREGKSIHIRAKLFPMIIENNIVAVYSIIKDITEKKEIKSKLSNLTYYDTLTGLPNRNFLENRLERLAGTKKSFALLFLDLDRFQRINNSLGHSNGDLLLQKVSKKLRSQLNSKAIVGRFSSDEFMLILPGIDENQKIEKYICRLFDAFSQPFRMNDRQIYISFSIGVSIYPDHSSDLEELIKKADLALHRAKLENNSGYSIYDSDLLQREKRVTKQLNLEGALRQAVQNNEFRLHYQPQIDIESGEVIGMEALIRWHHEEYGNVSPADFIPLAEEMGLIGKIGNWVLREAAKQLSTWQKEGIAPGRLGVNVSINQLRDGGFIDEVEQVVNEFDLTPASLELEVTENIVRDLEEIEEVLNTLQNCGVRVAVDDFGTGYSSLSVLAGLPINTLKIDRKFIEDSSSDEQAQALIKTIIELGENLGL